MSATLNVLLVDDEAELREELGQFLRAYDMQVEMAENVATAREQLHRKRFDLILLDLWLKHESGFDILRELHAAHDTPCIIMTAQDDVLDRVTGLKKAADDYILKPIQPRELLARIAAACKRGRDFLQNTKGSVSIMAAISLALLVAVAAIVLDAGQLYFARRDLQATTDAAALAAVQNPASASAIAASVFSGNGYSGQSLTVTAGTYSADEAKTAANRFVPSATGINAVKVQASLEQPAVFASYFGLGPKLTLKTQAVAARVATTAFGMGTGVASFNPTLLNSLLGKLSGSTVSLQLIDYQALALTNIKALSFINQLATDIDVSGSYEQLANSNVTVGQILGAMIETVTAEGGTGNPNGALLALKSLQLQLANATPVQLAKVVDLTPLYGRDIGDVVATGQTALDVNVMSIVSASARTLAAGKLIDLGTSLTIPVTNSVVTTQIAVGNPWAQTAVAQNGTTLRSAQIRMAITAKLAHINLVVATADVQVALYLDGGYGQATLTAQPCSSNGERAKISASSGLTRLQFGSVGSALNDFSGPLTPSPTPVVGVTLLTIPVSVYASGTADVVANGPTTLTFTQTDIDNGTVKTVPSGSATPFNTLGTNFTLAANVANNPLLSGLVSSLLSALQPIVAKLVKPLDQPLSETLATLGLALGTIDVRVFDEKCRTPTLVG